MKVSSFSSLVYCHYWNNRPNDAYILEQIGIIDYPSRKITVPLRQMHVIIISDIFPNIYLNILSSIYEFWFWGYKWLLNIGIILKSITWKLYNSGAGVMFTKHSQTKIGFFQVEIKLRITILGLRIVTHWLLNISIIFKSIT